MRRADRLLQIVQALRRRRGPVTAQALAEELEVSRRTIYRDIVELKGLGVPVDGEAGIGYILRPGYDLPPLMFTVEEVEAIVLGARLAHDRGDPVMARSAENVLAKVAAVLPGMLAQVMHASALFVAGRSPEEADLGPHLPKLREAIRSSTKLVMRYADAAGSPSERVVWPLALFYYSHVALIGAWCELRQDYRMFRSDRIVELRPTGERYDPRNGAVLRELLSATRRTGVADAPFALGSGQD